MPLREIFMYNVKFYRKKLEISQEKLAELADLSTNYIGDIERKKRKVTIDTIEKIALALNIAPADLLSTKNMPLKEKNDVFS